MGTTDDYSTVRLVVSYRNGDGTPASVTVPMPTLHGLAEETVCPTTLSEKVRTALLSKNFLVERGGELKPGPRLYWQVGRPAVAQ